MADIESAGTSVQLQSEDEEPTLCGLPRSGSRLLPGISLQNI